ncbi:Flp pilus assembly protein CpaB [Puniceibacterium sp. IMCC21224]|uniref:Flp pilus assembly protein CpaB n=1 Tax=Puniceibacterium sp. IMCC21224 TaxID=1618204 RepID=UPI00064DB92F|nr:Flp pilus assembly protein CpaB [Puniceibacterium sp. IMCC21224]KMK68345.1 Flp pilus assembly protein CpaB [Puniceibacterium sp. IMCC21224]
MRLVFGLVLLAGMALAGFAVFMAKDYIGKYQNALEQERARAVEVVPTQSIYVATRMIAYGEQILTDDVRLAPYPKELLPEVFFDEANPLTDADGQLRVAVRQIETNEPIMGLKVSEPGGDAGLTSRLERGQRAFTIKVDVASGVSGFLRPGDRVDVYWTGRIPGNDPNLPQGDVTKLIQTGVQLIAIDQSSNPDGNDATIARTVTVAAQPQQVAALAQAQSSGRLSLSLMNALDDTVAEATEVDQRSLLGITRREQKAEVKALEVCTIRTRRGAEMVEIPIPCTN